MPGYAKCTAGNCIREDYFCDGYVDCGDYSDEANCSEFDTIGTRTFIRVTYINF